MLIGTVRVEEAKALDSETGYHQFHDEGGRPFGSFEVFWHEPLDNDGDEPPMNHAGWFWWSCSPGCLPNSEPNGPFSSSIRARAAADENWS